MCDELCVHRGEEKEEGHNKYKLEVIRGGRVKMYTNKRVVEIINNEIHPYTSNFQATGFL